MTLDIFAQYPDLIPVAFDAQRTTLQWRSLSGGSFTSLSFDTSVDDWLARHPQSPLIETDVPVLHDLECLADSHPPDLFIVHLSRCGSTLLARALGDDPRNLVVSEPSVLNHFLIWLTGGDIATPVEDPNRLRMIRGLIGALGRDRGNGYTHYVLKLSSWNTLLLPTLSRAFPGVPFLFVYRHPEEVLVSIERGAPGFVREKGLPYTLSMTGLSAAQAHILTGTEFAVHGLRRIMDSALSANRISYLEYSLLARESLPVLVAHLGVSAHLGSLPSMLARFQRDAKTGRPFHPDTAAKQADVTPWIRELVELYLVRPYDALRASSRNLTAGHLCQPQGQPPALAQP